MYSDKRTNSLMCLAMIAFAALCALSLLALGMCLAGKRFVYTDVACTTCPCGAQYLTPYTECKECGISSKDGTYVVSCYCTNCDATFIGSDTCPTCGSHFSLRYVNGKVKDLPIYIRMWY